MSGALTEETLLESVKVTLDAANLTAITGGFFIDGPDLPYKGAYPYVALSIADWQEERYEFSGKMVNAVVCLEYVTPLAQEQGTSYYTAVRTARPAIETFRDVLRTSKQLNNPAQINVSGESIRTLWHRAAQVRPLQTGQPLFVVPTTVTVQSGIIAG